MALKIKEFPENSSFWRVDAVTCIKKNPNVDSEPLAQVLCSEIIDNSINPFLQSNSTGESLSVWVGVGQLAKIRLGSIWQNKKCIQIPSDKRFNIRENKFKIDTNKIIKTQWNHRITINNRTFYPIPLKDLNVGNNFDLVKQTSIYIAPCETGSTLLIIPSFVILSSYYISSSKIARAIFANDRNSLIVDDESELLENNNIKLVIRKNCDDADMYCLARWKADHIMQNEISNMLKKIQSHNINMSGLNTSNQTEGAVLDISFPFKGLSTLTVTGKFIILKEADEASKTKILWGFLVLSINECSHPYPYNEIHRQRHNDNEQIDGSNPTDNAWSGISSGSESTEEEDEEDNNDKEVASDDETNNNPMANIILVGTKFPDLNNKKIVKIRKKIQISQSDKNNYTQGASEGNQYGTGESTSQDTSLNPLNIRLDSKHDMPRLNLPSDIVSFFTAINYIRAIQKNNGWLIKSITHENRGWPIVTNNIVDKLSAFPIKITGCSSWHLMYKDQENKMKSIPRAIGIIQVTIHEIKTIYLLEMEKKADAHCLLIMRNQDYSPIEPKTINYFLRATARKNGWDTAFNNLYFQKVEHRHKSIKDFARKIIESILGI